VQEVEAQAGCEAIGVPLKELKLPKGVRVGVIAGQVRTVIAGAEDVIQPGDHVTLIGRSEAIDGVRRSDEAMITGICASPSARTMLSPPSRTTGARAFLIASAG